MKKFMIYMAAAAMCVSTAAALPKAFYVKQGEKITKYNFGVAENLIFSNNGRTLSVRGYGESINLDEIDYISFSAPLTEALTPTEQKERLVQIGTEAYNVFDVNDQADVLKMFHDFLESDYDDLTDTYIYTAPVEYYLPEEYYDVHKHARRIAEAMKSMIKGNPAAARIMKAATIDLYKIQDYYGIYTADKASESWKKTASDNLEIRFAGRDGSQYSLKLVAGKEFTTWTTRDFNGQFPREIDITVSRDNKTLATAHLSTVLVDRNSIDMTLDFDASGYVVKNTLKVVDDRIDDYVKVTIKGREYVTATSKVLGKNFVNYEEIYDAIEAAQGHDDPDGNWVDGDGARLFAMFKRAECSVDIMGKLQFRGMAYNGSKIYSKLSEDSSPYGKFVKDGVKYYSEGKILSQNGNTIHATDYDIDVVGAQMNVLNDHSDIGFYYDGNDKLQGYLGWDYVEDTWDRYCDYSQEPVTQAFCRVGDYLVGIHRNILWDENSQTNVLGPWKYYGYSVDDEYGEPIGVIVAANDVIFPEIVCHEYNIQPILWFPDGTSFAIEDFFDKDSFSRLIDDYNEIIDTYLSITGQK